MDKYEVTLLRIEEIRAEISNRVAELEFEVKTLRYMGCSWTLIAHSLGITRQAAWERWRYVEDSMPERTF
jgi:hypothetical protein